MVYVFDPQPFQSTCQLGRIAGARSTRQADVSFVPSPAGRLLSAPFMPHSFLAQMERSTSVVWAGLKAPNQGPRAKSVFASDAFGELLPQVA